MPSKTHKLEDLLPTPVVALQPLIVTAKDAGRMLGGDVIVDELVQHGRLAPISRREKGKVLFHVADITDAATWMRVHGRPTEHEVTCTPVVPALPEHSF